MILKCEDVSIRYITGDFKDIGLKEWTMRHLTHNYQVTEFWADRHVSFEIDKGDMLGIIGSNGAGKSTLLKAVSGIMEPTEGYIEANGRVSALLELGSGFDGDLTVRENAYLRGAMLGYTREFMDEAYEQIIEFSELQDFQDRPFKQLSSGMKSRLAFSIASLVEPEILILDEVLSVGDGAFRAKSEKKMKEIIGGGAATILVSHSIGQVRSMCNKILWLHKGEQIAFGDNVKEICDAYEAMLKKNGPVAAPEMCWLPKPDPEPEEQTDGEESESKENEQPASEEQDAGNRETEVPAEGAPEENEEPAEENEEQESEVVLARKQATRRKFRRWSAAIVAFVIVMTILSHLRAENIDKLRGSTYSPEAFEKYEPGSLLFDGDPTIYYVREENMLYYVMPANESTHYRFSLHVYPQGYAAAAAKAAAEEDIPERYQMQNMDFNFPDKEVYHGLHRKAAAVELPSDQIPEKIVTGQFYQNADSSYTGVWEEELDPRILCLPTAITAQPADVTAVLGEYAELSLSAEGEALSYQWQWLDKEGEWQNCGEKTAKTEAMTVEATDSKNGLQFRCIVTGLNGTVTSETATLTVK